MKKWTKCLVSFWLWVAVIIASFMMLIVSLIMPEIPQHAPAVFAAVILCLSGLMLLINPGIFARQAR